MYSVAVLGATGIVGQRFVSLLAEHPYFELTAVAASERSAGKRYAEAVNWCIEGEIPENVRDMVVRNITPSEVRADIVFSALPSEVAKKVEPEFAEAGAVVASNASAYRMEGDVPLLIPEVNPEHLDMIEVQRERRGWDGAIITNPNCSTIIGVLTLKPLMDAFGVEEVVVSTMQALSGAGYSGVPGMSILDNLLPYIPKEEEKIETETRKILGTFNGSEVEFAEVRVSASCTRVPVLEGHAEAVFVRTSREAEPGEVAEVMRRFRAKPQELKLPTAPEHPLIVREEHNRPQPRFDRNAGRGMSVTVGRVRRDGVMGVKYFCLGHNTIRGAAGASVLNAELMHRLGVL